MAPPHMSTTRWAPGSPCQRNVSSPSSVNPSMWRSTGVTSTSCLASTRRRSSGRSTDAASSAIDGSGMYGWAAIRPRHRLLKLRGDAEQEVLAAVRGDELDADREALGRPVQRQRDRRLSGGVEGEGEGREGGRPEACVGRVGGIRTEVTECRRRLGNGGGEEEIESALPPLRDAPRVAVDPVERVEQLCRRAEVSELGERPV